MLSFSVNPPQTKVVKFKLNPKVENVQISDDKKITITLSNEKLEMKKKTITISIDEHSVTLVASNQLSAETHYMFNLEDY